MAVRKNLFLFVLFIFIGFSVLYPNPYGNNPDIIGDESYFLTSSLASIEKGVPPGWEFSPSGAYYGGIQTYVDTAVLIPAIAAVFVFSHFSLSATKVWVALNTGELLHILRLVSGLTALIALAFCFLFFKKRNIPKPLGRTLTLFLLLIASNVMVIEFLHTAKMWSYYILLVAVTGAFFIAQEYYSVHLNEPFLRKKVYVALLIWSAVLTFFQSLFGAFSVGVLILYAYLLGHFTFRDLWEYVRTYWYMIALFFFTQVSFMYRAFMIRNQLPGASTITAAGSIDWVARLTNPLVYALESQPLSVLYLAAAIVLLCFAFFRKSFFADPHRRLYIGLACIYPVLTYLFFDLGIGLDRLPHYAILLTLACAFSGAILISELGTKAVQGSLVLSLALFAVVSVHAISLSWHPSSESVLLDTIEAKYNTPQEVFIIDHSARRMTLPVNYASLLLLDQKRQAMSRFNFLLQNQALMPRDNAFKALTLTAYLDEELSADIARFSTGAYSVWVISKDCTAMCSAKEMQSGTCFQINTRACGVEPQEVNVLPVFLAADQLGYSYIVRRVY